MDPPSRMLKGLHLRPTFVAGKVRYPLLALFIFCSYFIPGFTTQTRFPDQTSSGAGYNVTLLRHGFLGTAPSRPTLAISVHTLAMFRQINRVCPRLSDDAFCEALQHYHQV